MPAASALGSRPHHHASLRKHYYCCKCDFFFSSFHVDSPGLVMRANDEHHHQDRSITHEERHTSSENAFNLIRRIVYLTRILFLIYIYYAAGISF